MRRWVALLLGLGLALAAPGPERLSIARVLELAQSWKEVKIVGYPPLEGLGPRLTNAQVQILTGSLQPQGLGWMRELGGEIRVLKGQMGGGILLADGAILLVKDAQGLVLIKSPALVEEVLGRLRWREVWSTAARLR